MKPTQVCKKLRTKKMFIPALAHEAFAQPADPSTGTGHCWCNCTLTEVGPDDQPVGAQVCTANRSCFEE